MKLAVMAFVFFLATLAAACSSSGGDAADAVSKDTAGSDMAQVEYPSSGSSITLTGTLQAGKVTGVLSAAVESALQDGDPMAGYVLYCVTFTDPPADGTATADASGAFSLAIPAGGVPFGCVVRDAAGAGVAAVLFGKPGASSETVVVPGSAGLGTVVVDLDMGVASVALPAGATLVTTSTGAACPAGLWTGSVATTCGTTVVSVWLARTSANTILAVGLSSNAPMGDSGGCATVGNLGPGATWDASTRAFSMVYTGPSATYGYDGTVNADCTSIDGIAWNQPAGGTKMQQAMSYQRH